MNVLVDLTQKFGHRMTTDEVAHELGYELGTVYNKLSNGTLGLVPLQRSGKRFLTAAVANLIQGGK